MAEAVRLDRGKHGNSIEMAARAFQGYLEDKLAADNRRNDYLSWGGNNDVYKSMEAEERPYPEGEERARIHAAFGKIFGHLKNKKVFENAMSNTALMDSIFGVNRLKK